jgi:hypothetical protein
MNEEFKFTLTFTKDSVHCRYDTPEAENKFVDCELQRDPYLETIQLLEQWLKRWERIAVLCGEQARSLLVAETFNVLGDHLWKLAFDNEIGEEVINAFRVVNEQEEESRSPVRVRIGMQKDRQEIIAALPWEFVRFPGKPEHRPFFLAGEKALIIERCLADFQEGDLRPADGKVRVIFIMSVPYTQDTFEEQEQFRSLISDLRKIEALDIGEPLEGWQPREVASLLSEYKRDGKGVHVVHLVALCRDDTDGPKLYLPAEGGGQIFQDPGPVVRALTEDKVANPQLVVLHLGDWRGDDVPGHFERVAPSFIEAGIPAVLAMQYPMTPPQGPEFVKNFYKQLIGGANVGQAVQTARHGLLFGRPVNRHFGAPVLYLQSGRDGPLLQAGVLAETGTDAARGGESTRVSPPAGQPNDMRQRVLDWVVKISDPFARQELMEWAERQQWSDDLNKVWMQFQAKLRAEDDVRIRLACMQLMRKITEEMTGEAGP